jgi:SAM-dependent methyltransferase
MTEWYDDDSFWHDVRPAIFTAARIASAAGEVEAVRRLLPLPDGARVLDLGCGVGRHAVELARRGHRVTGVDRTAEYLAQAQELAYTAGVEVEWVHADIRSFRRDGEFDAVLSLLTSIGYSQDDGDDPRTLANVLASLRPGGQFVIDLTPKEVLARIFQERGWQELDGDALLLEERRIESGWQWLDLRWLIVQGGKRCERRFRLRLYSAVELRAMLGEAGFAAIATFGSLAGSPFDQTAERLVIVARR